MAASGSVSITTWGSRFGFLMAAIGSAVGLGNFWRFPYMAGENGGAAFVFLYLACVLMIGLPILISELAIGRSGRGSAVGAAITLIKSSGAPKIWAAGGWVAMSGGVMILCFYSVVAAWVCAYLFQMLGGQFVGLDAGEAAQRFSDLLDNTPLVIFWHTAFMAVTVSIVAMGVIKGIERSVTILMPLFFFMLLGMVVYAAFTADMGAAFAYLFTPDFSEVGPYTFVAALGQAFFSLSIGSAVMITYGAYLARGENIASSSGIVVGGDSFVSIIAGLSIFPFVFAFTALDPQAGPALFFHALPAAFAQMPGGQWVGSFFFFLAFIAALTSAISLLQVIVSFAEERTDFGRVGSAVFFGTIIWLVGVGCAYSMEFFGFIDAITERFLLPLGGLFAALFAGWVVSRAVMRDELSQSSERTFRLWRFAVRWLAPVAVVLIIVVGVADLVGLTIPGVGGENS